ncbi:hypothetical protein C9418_24735 [Rhizobium sp. SEMIA 4032]|nr:hypothetical protein C9418_24735 [Rhizobium sp. SEMIA 4032]
MWSPFVLSKQTESQTIDFTQPFFGQSLSRYPIFLYYLSIWVLAIYRYIWSYHLTDVVASAIER